MRAALCSALRTALHVARIVFVVALAWLIAVWTLGPETPAMMFQNGVITTLVVALATAAWPSARRFVVTRLRRPGRIAFVVACNIVGVLLLGELAIWALAAVTHSPLLAPIDARAAEQIAHHRYPPGGMHMGRPCNDHGCFDEPFEPTRRPGVRRIVALADSFGVGVVPYEQNFLTRLESELGSSPATEVMNFGVTGIGPLEYLHLWTSEASAFEPDLVLVCFFVGNDFMDRSRHSLFYPESLRTIAVAQRLWKARDWSAGTQTGTQPGDPDAATFSADDYRRIETDRLRVCARDWATIDAKTLTRTSANLDALHAAIGPRLRVVIIPDEFQVDDALWAELVAGRADEFDRDQPNRWLAGRLDALGVPFLDLLPPLRTRQHHERTYKLRDTHWNRAGNEVAARAIAAWLWTAR